MSAAIEKAYVTIAEGQLHLRQRAGASDVAADGLPLALLHASPASSRTLEPLMAALGPKRWLLAFDTPCNGQSCVPAVPAPAMADFADMIARGADALGTDALGTDALGAEPLALYGTHTGAHIAIEWALAHPDRVRALVLDGVALLDEAMRAEFLERYAPPQVPDESGAQFQWAWSFIRDQMIFFPHYRKDAEHIRPGGTLDPQVLHELVLDVLSNLTHYHLPYEAVFRHDVRAALAQLAVPTLVLGDAESALGPATESIAAMVPGAQIALGCDSPAAKARAIETFLKEHTGG